MYWHVQHDDHVFSGSRYTLLANDEEGAAQIVKMHNAEIDLLAGEIRRLRAEYQSDTLLNEVRRRLLDHLGAFLKRERTEQQNLETAFDCLNAWLMDNTELVYDEEPDIAEARLKVAGKIVELKAKEKA